MDLEQLFSGAAVLLEPFHWIKDGRFPFAECNNMECVCMHTLCTHYMTLKPGLILGDSRVLLGLHEDKDSVILS